MATGENTKTDDGSLAFLNIPRDEKSRSFNCDETTQSKLVNTSFWVCDFIEEVPTRFSKSKGTKGQTLVSPADFKQGIAPWLGWAKHSNSRHLLNSIIPKEYESLL